MTESSVLERHRTLCDIIERHNRDYYVLDAPTVSDAEYDALFRELRALEEKHPKLAHPGSPTQRVGAAPREGVVKAEHRRPMLSLDNAYSENDLREFHRRAMDRTPEGRSLTYVLEPKIDGASIEVIYRDGLLTQAITRGDGKIGEDVTESVRTIRTLPLRLPDTREFSLRGEIFIHGKDLDEINESRIEAGEEPFANPRNAASGSLRLLDSQLVAKRPLRVFFYDLVEPYFETHSEILAALKDLGLPTHGREERASTIEEIVRYIEHFDRERHGLPYETDGVVIKVDSLELRETLGYTARFPRWATAYKFAAEQAKTRVEAIRCDVGRTGTLTPVADLTPVSLSGTTVARASLHNIDYVESKDVRVGDMVWIQKAGEIIPQVLGVDPTARPPGASPWMPPTHCPVCQSAVARVEGEAALRCTNPLCPGRLRAALFHFTRRSAMDIDHVGRSLIEQLVASDLVKDLADLYGLRERREALLALDRMADKSADNVLGAIDASRTGRPFERFLTGLGIPLVGTVAARLIADQYADLPTLIAKNPDDVAQELAEIHGIGPKIADSVADYLREPAHQRMLTKFIDMGLTTEAPTRQNAPGEGPLQGKSFCVTGVLSKPRDVIHGWIRDAGGDVHTTVKKGTTYLVAGEKVGASKITAAEKKGTIVIDEGALRRLMEGTEG